MLKLTEAIQLRRNREGGRFTTLEFIEAISRLGFRITGNSRVRGPAGVLAAIESYLGSTDRESWSYESAVIRPTPEFADRVKRIVENTKPLDTSEHRERVNEVEDMIHDLLEVAERTGMSRNRIMNEPPVIDLLYRPSMGPWDAVRQIRGELRWN